MKKWIFAFLLVYGSIQGQENNYLDYLKNNKTTLDLNSMNQWELLKTEAEQNQFIILGESHGAQDAQRIDLNLLKYLNKTVGTKNYIAELDYAQSSSINEYLRTGNETILKNVFRHWVKIHAQWGNYDFYNKIVKIRALNNTLPKAQQITFSGIDKVQDFELYFKLIDTYMGDKNNPMLDSLRHIVRAVFINSETVKISSFANNYVAKIEKNKPEFEQLFGKNLPIFEYLIQNLSYCSTETSGVNRPEAMFRNYKQLYTILHLENEKIYGMFGFFHSHQVPVQFFGEDFASKLVSSDHPSAKKVISIVCLPIDSKYNEWDRKAQTWNKKSFSYDDKSLLQVDGIEDLKNLTTTHTTTLFKINGLNSPFSKTGRLFNGTATKGKLTGDFTLRDFAYQYVILMRNSDWLNPLPMAF
jgi:hypothetical protein